ncbi:MAG TPA: WecB/TagA/CpsF family glycosyltransferase, partial [Polyangia bacterium]
TVRRAPRWVSRVGLEWAYRLIREPRRLAGRYLLRDPEFLAICARQWWRGTESDPSVLPH